jgi:chromosome segregation ATPase
VTISDDDAKALRGLLATATPGPWAVAGSDKSVLTRQHDDELGASWFVVGSRPDATLIVAAVNALPALLDEREGMREDLEEFEVVRDELRSARDMVENYDEDRNKAWKERDAIAADNARLRGEVERLNEQFQRERDLYVSTANERDAAIAKLAEVEREKMDARAEDTNVMFALSQDNQRLQQERNAVNAAADKARDRIAQLEGELRKYAPLQKSEAHVREWINREGE